MAVKITTDGIVKMIYPEGRQFTLDEMNSHVEGWIEPLKIGPIWVVYREKSKEKGDPLNQVASFFFDVAIYGNVFVVPPQQMPEEWELVEEEDEKYTAEQVDTGFLSALQTALVFNRVFGESEEFPLKNFSKQIWSYTPSEEIDESSIKFFEKAYESIVKIRKDNDNILFEDDETIIRTTTPEDKVKTIKQMIDHFVEVEEYEKCAELQKLVNEYGC